MKKLLRKITAVLVAAGLMLPTGAVLPGINLGMTVVASAETVNSGTCGENLTWSLDENGTLTISGSGNMSDFGYLEMPWKDYLDGIITVEIGSSVTSIGKNAFSGCASLTSITIPENVISIKGYAFYECTSLQSVNIPNNVTAIDDRTFYECTSLTSITIPKNKLLLEMMFLATVQALQV